MVSALADEPFNDKPSIMLIFTEKDHSKEKRPKLKAAFGEFGSALIISLHEDGNIFGCEVAHAGLSKGPFSSIGKIRTTAFDVENGRIEGQLETDGEVDTFDQKWSVNLKFTAPYAPSAPKAAATTVPPVNKGAGKPPITRPGTKPASPRATGAKPAAPRTAEPAAKVAEPVGALTARQIPLSKGARDVEYQEPQITYKSPSSVRTVAGELTKALAAQGWKGEGPDIISDDIAMIARTRGTGTLSVIIKPEGTGSAVMMVPTEVEWGETEK